jgi:hypothetical protein
LLRFSFPPMVQASSIGKQNAGIDEAGKYREKMSTVWLWQVGHNVCFVCVVHVCTSARGVFLRLANNQVGDVRVAIYLVRLRVLLLIRFCKQVWLELMNACSKQFSNFFFIIVKDLILIGASAITLMPN